MWKIYLPEDLLHRRSVEPLVDVVRLDEEFDVCPRVRCGETSPSLQRADWFAVPVCTDVPRKLCGRVAGDHAEELTQEPLLHSWKITVMEVEQAIAQPLSLPACRGVVLQRKDICGVQECFDLFDGCELGGVEHGHHGKSVFP